MGFHDSVSDLFSNYKFVSLSHTAITVVLNTSVHFSLSYLLNNIKLIRHFAFASLIKPIRHFALASKIKSS